MKYLIITISFLLSGIQSQAQSLPTHKIYNKTGKVVKYGKMIKALTKAELIFIGEQHNNPISHWLEIKVIKSIHQRGGVVIGMEMFETDTQAALTEYMMDKIEKKEFLESTRTWSNYKTDYAPIIEYAKAKKINVVASNCPKQYANMVYKQGFGAIESLVNEEKRWLAPLPIPYDASLPAYKAMLNMIPGHTSENFPRAQAIKDATMANSIVTNWPTSGRFIHVNGAYHSDDFEGIVWYINQYRPETKVMTITTVVQSNVNDLEAEHIGSADFILVVDKDVTGSY